MNIENWVAVGLGGNMGNRLAYIGKAQMLLSQQVGRMIKCSSLYETAAWGNTDQPHFLNQAVILKTPFTPKMLLHKCLDIEKQLGRRREIKWGPRSIDIDILLYNDIVNTTETLQIPHPHMQDRRFVLQPLTEIAPQYLHPVFKTTLSTLLNRCADPLPVTLYHPWCSICLTACFPMCDGLLLETNKISIPFSKMRPFWNKTDTIATQLAVQMAYNNSPCLYSTKTAIAPCQPCASTTVKNGW